MRKFLSLQWSWLLFLYTAAVANTDAPAVLVFGDSLSAGYGLEIDQSWTALLQTRLRSQGYEHRVINASISGETTEGGAARIAAALEKHDPELVVLELGGNDGLRGFPPQRIKQNLRTVIETSQASGAGVVMLGIRIPPNYGPRYTRAFENVYRELADELDVPWIEFFMEGIALNEDLMQDDGIHPNAEAQSILLDNAWPVIREALDRRTGTASDRRPPVGRAPAGGVSDDRLRRWSPPLGATRTNANLFSITPAGAGPGDVSPHGVRALVSCPVNSLNVVRAPFFVLQGVPTRHSRSYGEEAQRRRAEKGAEIHQGISRTGH